MIVIGTASLVAPSSSVVAQGNFVYVANVASSTIQIFDVSNPVSPVSTRIIQLNFGPYYLSVISGYIYAVGGNSNMAVIDIYQEIGAEIVYNIDTLGYEPSYIYVQGRIAYVASYAANNIQLFDLGGAYLQQLEAGVILTSKISVYDSVWIGNNLDVVGGLNVSEGSVFNEISISSERSSMNGLDYIFPSIQGYTGSVLVNNGYGGLTWSNAILINSGTISIPGLGGNGNAYVVVDNSGDLSWAAIQQIPEKVSYTAKITVTASQFSTAQDTPITILGTPSPGLIYIIDWVTENYFYNGTPYSEATTLLFYLNGNVLLIEDNSDVINATGSVYETNHYEAATTGAISGNFSSSAFTVVTDFNAIGSGGNIDISVGYWISNLNTIYNISSGLAGFAYSLNTVAPGGGIGVTWMLFYANEDITFTETQTVVNNTGSSGWTIIVSTASVPNSLDFSTSIPSSIGTDDSSYNAGDILTTFLTTTTIPAGYYFLLAYNGGPYFRVYNPSTSNYEFDLGGSAKVTMINQVWANDDPSDSNIPSQLGGSGTFTEYDNTINIAWLGGIT